MKRNFKRLTALVLSLTLSAGMLPMSALAVQEIAVEDSQQISTVNENIISSGICGDDLTWTLDDAGTLTISGTGEMNHWELRVDVPWHRHMKSIKKIHIDFGVESIEDWVFAGCTNLTSITIPDSVTRIGDWAFDECKALTAITIPDSVTSIGSGAFSSCGNLKSVTIPNNVTIINDSVFEDCRSLKSITIPNSVTRIESSAFYNCSSLETITIPDSVTAIGEFVFYGCIGLKSITIPNSVKSIKINTFYNCGRLTTVRIPSSVKKIEDMAFFKCYSLKDVYYSSTKTSWKNISILEGNECLTNATIHYIKCSHEATKLINAKKATCAKTGYTGDEVCTVCGETVVQGEIIAKKKHTYVIDPAVKATYAKTGLTEGKHCSACGRVSVKQEVIPKLEVNRVSSSKMTVTNVTGRKLSVKWSKVSSVSGYQIEYATKSSYSNAKKITISSGSTTSKTISSLTKGKKYYVRMRAYKKYNSKNYYSKWTSSKSVTIKK